MTAAVYLDSSAFARVLFGRPGVQAPVARALVTTSELTRIELSRTIERTRLLGQLDDLTAARASQRLSDALSRTSIFPIGDEVLDLAAASFGVSVTALGAIHVATAQLILREAGALVFWTHESDRAGAAMNRGLEVDGVDLNPDA